MLERVKDYGLHLDRLFLRLNTLLRTRSCDTYKQRLIVTAGH
jgi:hypothetical protein